MRVPLELSTLPTAGEFRDAVASLSPEQQRFAKAVRGYQLSSTLFAVCVVQVTFFFFPSRIRSTLLLPPPLNVPNTH